MIARNHVDVDISAFISSQIIKRIAENAKLNVDQAEDSTFQQDFLLWLIAHHPENPPSFYKIMQNEINSEANTAFLKAFANAHPYVVQAVIFEAVNNAANYGKPQLLTFAKFIGLDLPNEKSTDINIEKVQKEIVTYLKDCFVNLQKNWLAEESKFSQQKKAMETKIASLRRGFSNLERFATHRTVLSAFVTIKWMEDKLNTATTSLLSEVLQPRIDELDSCLKQFTENSEILELLVLARAYQQALIKSDLADLSLSYETGATLFRLRWDEVKQLIAKIRNHEEYDIATVKNNLRESLQLLEKLNALQDTARAMQNASGNSSPLNNALLKVYKSGESFRKASGKKAAELLIEPTIDTSKSQLLGDAIEEVTQSLPNPLAANIEKLNNNAALLQNKWDLGKQLGGSLLMLTSAILGVASVVFALASIALAKPSFGGSMLIGLPASYYAYHQAASLFSRGYSLFSAGCKQNALSKATTDFTEAIQRYRHMSH